VPAGAIGDGSGGDGGAGGPADPDRAANLDALELNGGVLAAAAADLGLSRQALYRRMERHGITRNGGGSAD
jgi:transcriptional regulator of acetoin/glycerol metabolism